MLKAIQIESCLMGTISSRVDGSLKLSFVTPELLPSQSAAILPLHGKNVRLSIVPQDVAPEEAVHVTTERQQKTPSQRLRASLFVWFRQQNPVGDNSAFNAFYEAQMERLINSVKEQLDPI